MSDQKKRGAPISLGERLKRNRENRKRLQLVSRQSSEAIRTHTKAARALDAKDDPASYAAVMRDPCNVVEFDDLHTYFFTDVGVVKAVDGVSFDIPQGSTVGVVGESGCGKSVTSLSLMRLVQAPTGQIISGSIRYNDGQRVVDITKLPTTQMRKIRGNEIAMIFQEPMTSLNPVFTIGAQIEEAVQLHQPDISKDDLRQRAIEMLALVGIADAERVYKRYPHELSGGMRQRAMIAMSLSCDPRLIIADEPTTALDVTLQAQILDLLRELKHKINASIMLITHDLGVVAEMADYVVVMYAGRIIEQGLAREIYHDPRHPYTIGLLNSRPRGETTGDRLYSIPGQVPNPINMPPHCYFKARCERCVAACDGAYPALASVTDTHRVACWRLTEGGEQHV